MNAISIDIETTGLDSSYCQILEFGAVAFDTENDKVPVEDLPSMCVRFYYDKIVGEPIALAMNAQLISEMHDKKGQYPWVHIDTLYSLLLEFKTNAFGPEEKVSLTGKNLPTFDLGFLEKVPRWTTRTHFARRLYDPAIYFLNRRVDKVLPDTKLCIERADVVWDSKLLHSAVWDARLVVELTRRGLNRMAVVENIDIDKIMTNYNMETDVRNADTGMKDLEASIQSHGLQNPIQVQRDGPAYKLVNGRRRLEAFKLLGRTSIPAMIQ